MGTEILGTDPHHTITGTEKYFMPMHRVFKYSHQCFFGTCIAHRWCLNMGGYRKIFGAKSCVEQLYWG